MNQLSHLFVIATHDSSTRKVAMVDRDINKQVELNRDDIMSLTRNWAFYTDKSPDFVGDEISEFSDEVRTVFKGLIENLKKGAVSDEYIIKQTEQFGKAYRSLKK